MNDAATSAGKVLVHDRNRVVSWVLQACYGSTADVNFAVGVERSGKLVAGFIIYGWNGAHALLTVRVDEPMSTTREWWRLMFAFPFVQLRAKCLRATILATNEKSLDLARNAGMLEEHRMVDARPEGDVIMFLMRPNQCRFLNWKKT